MKATLSKLWFRVGVVCLAYALTMGLLFSSAVSSAFIAIILALPLAITALAFGVLAGVAFGLVSGALVTTLTLSYDPLTALLNVLVYMSIGAAFGFLHPRTESSEDHAPQEAWEHALDVQFWLDQRGKVLASNLKGKNIFGQPTSFFDLVHPEEREKAREQLEYAVARDEARWTLRVVNLDQSILPVEAQLIRDGERLSLELHDLSEMYEIERRLSETEARYRVLIEDAIASLDTGIVIVDRNQQVIWANQALAHLMGVDQEWLLGRDLERVLHEASPRFMSSDITEKIASGPTSQHMTIAMQNGQGPRIYDYNSIPISTERYEGGRIDYYHDITKNKELEAELRQKTERLSAANERLEAFTHVVSHDLKEPLRTLEMFSSYVIEDYEDKLDEEGKDYLNSIARASRRMKGLIDGLLDLASVGRRDEPRELTCLNTVVGDVLKDLEASLDGVQLELPSEPFPEVEVNRTRVEQLFANLISNGVKYNENANKAVRVGWSAYPHHYEFFVKDNGIGIEKEYVGSRIFELFERLNPHQDNYESTGAGLAICKRIVEEYGGTIWAESEFGQGSTFYFTLPKPNTKVVNHHEAVEDLVG